MFQLYFDKLGTIYKTVDGKTYFLIIDKNDDISWEEVNVNVLEKIEDIDKKITYSKISHVKKKNELHRKVIDMLVRENELEEDEDYYPESHYFRYEEADENNEYSYAKYNDSDFVKLFDYTFGVESNYDTIIIDDKIFGKTEQNVEQNECCKNVIFALESMTDCSYRITIYTSGYIELNIIGSRVKRFNALY